MKKTIWTIWFQGREKAPPLVRSCIQSWEDKNPEWELRCLDATTIEQYVPVREHFDLKRQVITHASLSDIARILLLHEYGGVWVDATTWCNRPLDTWLAPMMVEGFFAFAKPGPDRPLSSWFLAAVPGHPIISRWCERTLRYWSGRTRADHYFWFHYLFRELCETDPAFASAWELVPKISAVNAHVIQGLDLTRPPREIAAEIDTSIPVFKLTHRLPDGQIAVLSHLPREATDGDSAEIGMRERKSRPQAAAPCLPPAFASLKVSTDNLGDHVQILASGLLLRRFGIFPERLVDRDDELRSAPSLGETRAPIPIVLGGWFKRNGREWPPNEKLLPLFLGFHIRLFQCPELVSPEGIAYLQRFAPIGCRDPYTCELLLGHGVEAYVSGCLSMIFPRRHATDPEPQEVIVVSRDKRLLESLPPGRGPYTYVCAYTGSSDFGGNMARAEELLGVYRSRAKLIITSMLHCALPAMAMGIPVIPFYPINDAAGHASDQERFSLLGQLTRVYTMDEVAAVDWNPQPVDVSALKLILRDSLAGFLDQYGWSSRHSLGPIADASELPWPGTDVRNGNGR